MSRDHRKLKAFQLADELAIRVYRETRGFPKDEWFGLRSQMRRAAVSVPSNIVEGAARSGQREYVQFLNQAFNSLRELGYYIDFTRRLEYLTDKQADDLAALHAEASRVLAALINAVQ